MVFVYTGNSDAFIGTTIVGGDHDLSLREYSWVTTVDKVLNFKVRTKSLITIGIGLFTR